MNNYDGILEKTKELILAIVSYSKIKQTSDYETILFDGFTKLFDHLYFINSVV